MIQLISLRFNYKRKHPSYPSPLDRGSTFSNKLPLVSQESLNYRFYSLFAPFPPFVLLLSCVPSFFFYTQVCCTVALGQCSPSQILLNQTLSFFLPTLNLLGIGNIPSDLFGSL